MRHTPLMDCLLCRIVARTEEASFVYADEWVVAICDLYPVNPGHLFVFPKAHAVGLDDLDAADGGRMFAVAQRLAAALRRTDLHCEGINLFLADGAAAFQDVFHVHLHVIPRYKGDGFTLNSGQSTMPTARRDLDAIAARIGERL
jgi:histidine triad (HIT) family protein